MKRDRWQEISGLYRAALELPADERAAFLKTCADEDLQREVLALLADESRLGDFLENPALEVAGRLRTKGKTSLIGAQLGFYHIVSELGRGGMGEVFRAKDQKLGRDVAIKVLHEEFAKDADRVSRFRREAKLLASLNHPNIAAIYGLEESGGSNFIVLELVEGETLAEQLKRGPIPVEESLKSALQISEALEAAHEKGVIHRDLKPGNIKVDPNGKVKVLDFGLAKAFAGEQEANLSNSPTLSNTATQQGVILGTAAYMSPEQARGKSVDKRADIWSFGCVLYEMLTGHAAFQGEDVSEILASVIKGDVKLDLLPATIHPKVHEILSRCIQKDVKKRYRDIGDARFELEQVLAGPSGVWMKPIATVEYQTKLRSLLPWLAAAVVLGAIIAGVAVWMLKPTPPAEPRQVTRFSYDLPKDYTGAFAVSPNGRQFVCSTSRGLNLRSMDQMEAKLVTGTDGNAQLVFFSPDGKWIGYFFAAGRQLKKISISGGAPVVLCDVDPPVLGATWEPDNTIVYSDLRRGIMRISADGGTPEQIIKAAENEDLTMPKVLPGGEFIMFTRSLPIPWKIMVQSLKSGERKELFPGDSAKYLPTGHIVYALDDNLIAIPFNLDRLEVAGAPITKVEGLYFQPAALWNVSDSGTLVYVPGIAATAGLAKQTLVWVNRNGKEEPIAAAPNDYRSPRISPDGTKVALAVGGKSYGVSGDIWIWEIVRETMTRLTFDTGDTPLWTPDGKQIVFSSVRESLFSLYRKATDGSGREERIFPVVDRRFFSCSWTGNTKTLVTTETGDYANWSIGVLAMEGDRARKPLLQNGIQPQVSPNGRWMAYTSNESGQNQIYVRPYPEVNSGRWQISTSGGDSPLWSRDGRELFYRNGDAAIAVSVKTDPGFSFDEPKTLFRGTYTSANFLAGLDVNPWDISPDGKRFLMMKPIGNAASAEESPRQVNIVLNWIDELKQRIPAK
jgi:eukaryotic-like serine/threonine-protein kinase